MAQFAALAATYAIYFACMALVEEKTRSSAQMGLMVFSSPPGFLFGMLAGVVGFRRVFAFLALIVLGFGAVSVRQARG